MGQTHQELSQDGCVSVARTAKIVGMNVQTLRYWITQGLFDITLKGEGSGNFSRLDLRDVTAAYAVHELRRHHVSLQACRKVHRALLAFGEDFASARLLAFNRGNGNTDVLIAETAEEGRGILRSILEAPDQVVITEIALHGVSDQLRRRFETALALPVAKRGRPKGKRNSKPTTLTPAASSTADAIRAAM